MTTVASLLLPPPMDMFKGFVNIYTLPESWAAWEPEAAGDNTRAHVEGDRVRVQRLTENGYYDWSCGTITECANTDYIVRFDGDQYYDAGDEYAVCSVRVHPAATPAAGPATASDESNGPDETTQPQDEPGISCG